ncbi:MAG: 5-formyltetrahydrofolate cyclo-ligase [Burkholderiales bacterium]
MSRAPDAASLTGPQLHDAKRTMRNAVIAARDAMPDPVREAASATIAQRIAALPSFAAARCLLLTLPFRSEWDTRPLIAAAHAQGKTVVLPRVDDAARMLDVHVVRDVERDTAPGFRGIPEPAETLPRVELRAIDWVLVPGVAFDVAGRRLGYGGGYYDRLLALLDAHAQRVAGAFDLQVVAAVPAAPHDLVVDLIVTETRLLPVVRGH